MATARRKVKPTDIPMIGTRTLGGSLGQASPIPATTRKSSNQTQLGGSLGMANPVSNTTRKATVQRSIGGSLGMASPIPSTTRQARVSTSRVKGPAMPMQASPIAMANKLAVRKKLAQKALAKRKNKRTKKTGR